MSKNKIRILKSRKQMLQIFGVTLDAVQNCSLIQKKVLEGLQSVGDTFNENKTSEFHNSEVLK